MMQSTLYAPIRFSGIGLHTGEETSVEICAAPAGFGVQFAFGNVRIPATAENVIDTSRATVIGAGACSVSTVEHLLSALFGMGVTNADVIVHGPEIPVVDGSAHAFAEAIAAAGVELQSQPCATVEIDEPFEIRENGRALILLPHPSLRVRFVADYPAPIGAQYFDSEIDAAIYRTEIAPARTFGYLHEVETLYARGLALGGTLENAVVFSAEGAMQELRWPDEVVRHKVLDLLGDLALLGVRPSFDVIAIKSGHDLHVRAVRELRRRYIRGARERAS
jgi:UDP-3-O-[3-hydroxymyristoyl] N-acetylglucosamine deacetylase